MVFLWVPVYGLVYALASRLEHLWAVPLAMTAYAAVLIGWLFHTGRAASIGLRFPRERKIWGLPLLLMLPVCNLLCAESICLSLPSIVLMLSACAVEEIFFRGLLLRCLMPWGALRAVVVSSGLFALLHLANILSGSGYSQAWMQVLCSFAVGVCYAAAAVRLESLIPCYLAHFFTNITAAPVRPGAVPWLWLCAAGYGCLGIYLCKNISVVSHEEDRL